MSREKREIGKDSARTAVLVQIANARLDVVVEQIQIA
jgi:hypothetical protein